VSYCSYSSKIGLLLYLNLYILVVEWSFVMYLHLLSFVVYLHLQNFVMYLHLASSLRLAVLLGLLQLCPSIVTRESQSLGPLITGARLKA
jgi:hypothetical protein